MIVLLILIVGFLLCAREAIKRYKAENYASQKVQGKKIGFIPFMTTNYPIMSIVAVVLGILIVLALLGVGRDTCSRCGRPWSGDGYCFGCQAELKGYK